VPHCETCDRFYNPNTLKTDGTCPVCGRQVAEKLTRFETEGAPWHFKVLVTATVIYLGWRFVQLIFWAFT
jgi:predicted RNA-binding Zn-ribbon protein involved in translation (DUF1610 family)